VYIGWCDGVQARDGNTAHTTHRTPRAETPVVWTGSLGAPQARIAGPRMGARQYNHNNWSQGDNTRAYMACRTQSQHKIVHRQIQNDLLPRVMQTSYTRGQSKRHIFNQLERNSTGQHRTGKCCVDCFHMTRRSS